MKSNILRITTIVFGITMITFQSACAQSNNRERGQEPPSFSELLEMMDKNKDGKLAESEVKGPLKDHFKKIDADEDGFITEEEMEKAPKPKRRERNK
ncbi:EF-hand domain-containing protein [Croceitalea vernalis]|uniref:EF-hand domain-containing protein n=1 Tax=Croceitalea vernalis TaxID=3075599 RepID=A0ABU3BIC8_9FLAO|nr:EF-hand domain-containing protein [Croceitalea sp. P007]MDT0621903.1 EF-hand domain-containing protein [Croceitalea sp. P007]